MCHQLIVFTRVIDITQERDGWVDFIYLDLKNAYDKRSKQLHNPICRWYEITKGDKKPQGLREVIEWHKQDIWMKQDMGNGI